MKHILTIVGARPQFIKAAAISHVISEKYSDSMVEEILHTGQHYDDGMSARFFRELDIPAPRYNLDVGSGTHGAQTASMLNGIERVLLAEGYDAVIVYGDTNSTLAGAMAAAKLGVPVMHVEAGLRSFNRTMPEELNRVLTDHASTLLFAPTATAVQNLRNEGFAKEQIVQCGDVMLDNVLRYSPSAECPIGLPDSDKPLILCTVHRNFNTDDPARLNAIVSAVGSTARRMGAEVMFPVHPRTRNRLEESVMNAASNVIHFVQPLSYMETLAVLKRARLVMTDSGGLQKEAFFSGRPCVVLRDETEWIEIVDCGAAMLSSPDALPEVASAMWSVVPSTPVQFGNGHAAECIVEHISRWLDRP